MTRHLAVVALAAILAFACEAGTHAARSSSSSPAVDSAPAVRLVREYVERDARGERLRSNPWFLNAVIWEDEPAFDSYTLISRYEIVPLHTDSSTGRVEVTYYRAGYVRTTGGRTVSFEPDTGREVQVFTVALTFNGWRIVAPQLDQHVLLDAALAQSPFSAADRNRIEALKNR